MSFEYSSYTAFLLDKADAIFYKDALTMFLGFSDINCSGTDQAQWAICKVEKDSSSYPITQTIKWANGTRVQNLIFDNCETFDYYFKKFDS